MKKVFCIFVLLAQIPSIGWADACQAGYQPVDYQVLEYIESTGTQYIDLGRKVRSDYTYKIKVAWTRFGYYTFMSSKEYSDWMQGKYLGITYVDVPNKIWYSRSGTDTDYGTVKKFNATANTIYDIDWKPTSGHIDVNGTTYTNDPGSHQQTTDVFETAKNMYLFAANSGGTATGMDYAKLYSWQMYDTDGTTLLMNLIPVRRKSDNAIGMYDTVSGQFFTNAGTGTFIAGPEKPFDDVLYSDDGCVVCPPNTYKDTVENVPCTPCPSTTFSKSGSTSINDCGHVMHVGDKIYFLNSQKLTTPALHVRMPDGSIYYGSLYRQQTE